MMTTTPALKARIAIPPDGLRVSPDWGTTNAKMQIRSSVSA